MSRVRIGERMVPVKVLAQLPDHQRYKHEEVIVENYREASLTPLGDKPPRAVSPRSRPDRYLFRMVYRDSFGEWDSRTRSRWPKMFRVGWELVDAQV